ncbi:hypothetical protein, partial [Pandoraea pneumonica]|uniref:hypothetical protein n=1 Tax=Pandoraea pneumonica TaxID=2508299 RepID=UPI003CED3136
SGKILVVGVFYVVLECVGFFVGIGLDVIVMVRFIFFRVDLLVCVVLDLKGGYRVVLWGIYGVDF